MQLISADPRSLKENPDRSRQSKSSPQSDALLCASIKAIGVVQPPVVRLDPDGGNSYIIVFGHRRAAQAIAAELAEIPLLLAEPTDDLGAMQSLAENIAREPLNPVDQWRAIERLVALGWTEESIALALALAVRQIRKLRLLANILPAILDQMARGDMPNEQQLRTIAAASQEEQAEVWKKYKPKKQEPQVSWWDMARALTKTRMLAKDASFGDELAAAYGIVWQEDLFAPADQDGRFTTDVEAFLGAQQEWLSNNLPKRGTVIEVNDWGQPKLPPKANQIYGKPGKGDNTGWYINPRDGSVQSVAYRLPENKAKTVKGEAGEETVVDAVDAPRARPDVTQKGLDMIGDLRTDALHEALARAPIEDDMLIALLILGFAGTNVTIASGSSDNPYGHANGRKHAAKLIREDGKVSFDRDLLQRVARALLIDVMSCRRNRSDSGLAARIAGEVIGADQFLVNTATEEFLSCLSRNALEAVAGEASVPLGSKVKETRATLVAHFADDRFVHPAALIAPSPEEVRSFAAAFAKAEAGALSEDGDEINARSEPDPDEADVAETESDFREAAE
ncbi:ParB/RepB/Spo0J family partition protein (plasmid) [Rhizobium bangladeshense]|uniref:ParB/RepB/Spo0J family partition protein n=1 Tax=Rhizobium bangladeshense TaxID=1138189 RepID=UPI001A99BA04|nr:ParB/RepB/Spo0J family partition protein [Rhizobium bangladeshense]QSY98033.1 ParB/RepB/Spo0J family partition protein [Rhizobium bangladeshense]